MDLIKGVIDKVVNRKLAVTAGHLVDDSFDAYHTVLQ